MAQYMLHSNLQATVLSRALLCTFEATRVVQVFSDIVLSLP
jgi:hypothetical protein